jgi:hypothetical protein
MTNHHGLREVPSFDLAELEDRFQHAFVTGHSDGLEVIGAGEMLPVIGWTTPFGRIACKRLPRFRDHLRLEKYAKVFHDYLRELTEAGVDVVPTTLLRLEGDAAEPVAYAVQPRLDEAELLPVLFRDGDRELIPGILDQVFTAIQHVLDRGIGIDAQVSNWAWHDGVLLYFDVTTPFLRDEAGAHRLDPSAFTASLPWVIRGLVTGPIGKKIMDAYFDRRTVVLDLLGNLIKERFRDLLDDGLRRANRLLDRPVTIGDVERYYARDARLWGTLQRLRRWDRAWQINVRRRPYRQLLPEGIER